MAGRSKRYSFIEDVQFAGGEFYADEDWSVPTSTLHTKDMYRSCSSTAAPIPFPRQIGATPQRKVFLP